MYTGTVPVAEYRQKEKTIDALALVNEDVQKHDIALPEGAEYPTLRSWMLAHDGGKVHTYQRRNDGMTGLWAPGPRTVLATGTGVYLDNGRREYYGSHVVASDDRLIVIETVDHIVAYVKA